MIRNIRNIYIHSRFFLLLGIITVLFVLGFPFPPLFLLAKIALAGFVLLMFGDVWLLFGKVTTIVVRRELPKLMSLGNVNVVATTIKNDSDIALDIKLFNQYPFQFQLREGPQIFFLNKGEQKTLKYELKPLVRGEYDFGKTILFVSSVLSLLERRILIANQSTIPVFPSVMDVKKYDLLAIQTASQFFGVKQIRRLGQSFEFEQISDYTVGDDYHSINWKATSRSNRLMVNKFTDEKAQPVYCFIDKSRNMKMPFKGMSLLDYAINTSLIISNTALRKDDKVGLLTFSDTIESFVLADKKTTQFRKILQSLYKEKETKIEANYELLYTKVRQVINGRSLIFFYANFESIYALERVLPVLRKLNKIHLLVVVVFQNTELEGYTENQASDVLDIYNQTIARKFLNDKKQVIMSMKRYGIQVIYSKPEELSINSINKYLEIKSRGMI